MKICILGVGRSGTTAIYTFLQEILMNQFGNDVDFVYEPFLWNKDVFNGKHSDVIGNFKYMDSISIEGIYHHQKLPLFIENPGKYKKNEYLKSFFFRSNSRKNILIKCVRANGRFLLLNKICPKCKFIFIIRNPLDVINSVIVRFSFFGGEFHRDDFKRFADEVNVLYGANQKIEVVKTQVEKEVLYWYYMNKFALESFVKVKPKPLIICYEDYISQRKEWVDKICSFLELTPKDKFYSFSETPGGSKTETVNLNKQELKLLTWYLKKYQELLKIAGIGNSINYDKLIAKYEKFVPGDNREALVLGRTPNHMNNLIKKMRKEMKKKDEEIKRLRQRLAKIEG